MLPDTLWDTREQVVDELEHYVDAVQGSGPPSAAHRHRLERLLEDLINALRSGGIDEQVLPCESSVDPAIERDEHEFLRRYVIGKIEHHQLEASASETAKVSEWAYHAEQCRMLEENRRLRALLDEVDESTAIMAPGGHLLYVNGHEAECLRRACGVPPDKIVGSTSEELAVPVGLGLSRSHDEVLALARTKGKFESVEWGRTIENQFDAMYAPDGTVTAVTLVMRDVQARKLALSRLSMLSKLSTMIGALDYDEVAAALSRVPIPELADWCAVNIIQNNKIRRTFIAQRDPAKAPIREALLRSLSLSGRHPLWQEMLTGGFQLLSEVTDDLVRKLSINEEQYRLLSQLGIRSLMVMPIVSRGHIAGIFTLLYTNESSRRYDQDDPALARELAVHAAEIMETARLMTELKSSEARFRIALAGARTVVFEQDLDLRYSFYYNPLSLSHPPFVGKTQEQTFSTEEATRLASIKKHVLDTGERAFEELDLTVPGDERRHYREAVEALRDRSGRIVGIVGASTDITEQQRAQQQLTDALGLRERIMSILGHDLRNPLNTINLAGGLLLNRLDLAPDARNHILLIRRAADRMREMIETLLDFTRARFLGKIPISRVSADLGQIANDVCDELRVAWPDHNIEVEVRGDARGEWDPARIAQTISNLVGNAFTYGDPHTPVRVSIDGTGDDVVLKVKNQGSPIPVDVLPVLFEPFRRGVPEDKSPRGLGLGLYIVKQIVLAHDGTINVDSTAKDGTTVTVQLPRTPTSLSV
jgi:phosphoserine phosphatase RsbU/P